MNESYKNLLLQNEIQRNLVKVSFELDLTYGLFVNFLHKMSSKFIFEIKSTKNLIYYSYSAQKLVKNNFKCDKTFNNGFIFSETHVTDCLNDCVIELLTGKFQ
jgi:hypothetical protein